MSSITWRKWKPGMLWSGAECFCMVKIDGKCKIIECIWDDSRKHFWNVRRRGWLRNHLVGVITKLEMTQAFYKEFPEHQPQPKESENE